MSKKKSFLIKKSALWGAFWYGLIEGRQLFLFDNNGGIFSNILLKKLANFCLFLPTLITKTLNFDEK